MGFTRVQVEEQTMNLVEYYHLLKRETLAVEDFLNAAKTVSASYSDLPDNALKMVVSDGAILIQFYDSFERIDGAVRELRGQISDAAFRAMEKQ
jgi:hypothetical protein